MQQFGCGWMPLRCWSNIVVMFGSCQMQSNGGVPWDDAVIEESVSRSQLPMIYHNAS